MKGKKAYLLDDKEINLVKRSVSKYWTYALEKKDVELCDQLEKLQNKILWRLYHQNSVVMRLIH